MNMNDIPKEKLDALVRGAQRFAYSPQPRPITETEKIGLEALREQDARIAELEAEIEADSRKN